MIGKIHMINPDKNIVEYGRIGNGITESTLATKLRSVKLLWSIIFVTPVANFLCCISCLKRCTIPIVGMRSDMIIFDICELLDCMIQFFL